MGALSDKQFATSVNAGGASRMLHSSEDVPLTHGNYAVSDTTHEKTFDGRATYQGVTAHRGRMLADPEVAGSPNAMQGGWAVPGSQPKTARIAGRRKPRGGPTGDKVYLDSSNLVTGRQAAVETGRDNKQIAVFSHSRALQGKDDTEVYMKQPKVGPQTNVAGRRKRPTQETATPKPGQRVVGDRRQGFTLESPAKPRVAGRRRRS